MAIPAPSTLYAPLLRLMEDGVAYTRPELIEAIEPSLNLTEEDKVKKGCGGTLAYQQKIKKALTDMAQVGLLVTKNPHVYMLSSDAKAMLAAQAEDADFAAHVAEGLKARRTQR